MALCFLFAPFARAREPRLSLAATVEILYKAIEQRLDQQRRSEAAAAARVGAARAAEVLSQLIHESNGGLAAAIIYIYV